MKNKITNKKGTNGDDANHSHSIKLNIKKTFPFYTVDQQMQILFVEFRCISMALFFIRSITKKGSTGKNKNPISRYAVHNAKKKSTNDFRFRIKQWLTNISSHVQHLIEVKLFNFTMKFILYLSMLNRTKQRKQPRQRGQCANLLYVLGQSKQHNESNGFAEDPRILLFFTFSCCCFVHFLPSFDKNRFACVSYAFFAFILFAIGNANDGRTSA